MTITETGPILVHVQPQGDLYVAITGQLVAYNRNHLKQKVLDAIAERTHVRVSIDLAQCGYIDASALGVLVSLTKKVRESQGELVLQHVSPELRVLFELTRLDTLFQIEG